MIPYSCQWIDQDDINAVTEVLKSDMITTGSKVKEFEEAVAKYVGSKYAVAVSSGTAALHLAMLATDSKGIMTSPNTFLSSANCAHFVKGHVKFIDICKDTYNIDIGDIINQLEGGLDAIIPVDFAGQPCKLDELKDIARDNYLHIIEDASHALGAEYKGKKVGSISELTVFSFHPVKMITTGEGGMITTDNEIYYDDLLMLRNHGITRDKKIMNEYPGDWYYEMQMLGYNYRLTDIQCALGISQLKKLDRFIKRRREIAKIYDEELANDVVIPYQKPNVKSAYHLYVIQVENRDKVFAELRKRGIGCQVHYIPVYKQPFYKTKWYGDCPVMEEYYKHCLSIPIFPKMTDEDVKRVISEVKDVIKC